MSQQRRKGPVQNAAQDPDELFDVLSADGAPTGEVKARALVHRDGDWHRAVHVWVAGVDDGGSFILLQRRSLEKDTWPGWLDVTVGGHYRSGEGLDQALREIEEEIGVTPSAEELRPLGVRRAVSERETGVLDRELQDVFLWRSDAPLTAYTPNAHELLALIKAPLEPLLDLLAGDLDSVRVDCLNAADRSLSISRLQADDFVFTIDRYFYRSAIAVSRALRGERHIAI
ncbi:MAG: NUDIX hydrolase [Thermomicrobiales bacterium]